MVAERAKKLRDFHSSVRATRPGLHPSQGSSPKIVADGIKGSPSPHQGIKTKPPTKKAGGKSQACFLGRRVIQADAMSSHGGDILVGRVERGEAVS